MVSKLLKLAMIFSTFGMLGLFTSCDLVNRVEVKAARINKYEKVAMQLAYKNRQLNVKISKLEHQLQALKSKNNFLNIKMNKDGPTIGRLPASIVSGKNDLVQQGIYKWSPGQLLATAEQEFQKRNFEKSSQFFQTFITEHKSQANDQLYFQAGIAAFESGEHHDWALQSLHEIVAHYPQSKYYRGAKLWMALTHLKLGDEGKFYATVEEFRKKYKNTPEWKILSTHYASIRKKYSR